MHSACRAGDRALVDGDGGGDPDVAERIARRRRRLDHARDPLRVRGDVAPYGPDIASNAAGDVLITWLESDVLASVSSVEAQLVSGAGTSSHASWPVNAGVEPSVALSADGSLGMIAWLDEDDYNTYAVSLTPGAGWGQP